MIGQKVSRRSTRLIEHLESRQLMAVTGLPIRIGGGGIDLGRRIAAAPDGGFIAAGLFSGKVDFDPGAGTVNLTARGDTDIYVAKYTSAGALQWARRLGGDELPDEISDQEELPIAADPRRAGGEFLNGVGSDPALAAEYVNDIAITPDGGVVLVGSFLGEADFNPAAAEKLLRTSDDEFHDAFVLKLNANGNFAWVSQFGGRFTELASSVAVDTSGSLYVGGLFTRDVGFVRGNTDFNRTATGRNDAFVMKLSNKGRVRWLNTFGGEAVQEPLRDAVNDLAVDSAGNVYAVGTASGDLDLDPSNPGNEMVVDGRGGVIIKYSTNGRYLRAVSFLGEDNGYTGLTSVAVDSDDNVIIGAYFQDQIDVNPGPGTQVFSPPVDEDGDERFTDVFIQKLSGNLGTIWARRVAGTGYEFIDQIAVDSADNILVSGAFYGTARFGAGPSLTSTLGIDDFDDDNDADRDNSYDAFLWKLTATGNTSWARKIGQAGDDFGTGVAIGSDDSILWTGRYRGTTDFDPGSAIRRLRGLGVSDGYVTQFAPNGAALL